MGAQTFIEFHAGADVREAFAAATEQARHEHGHGGYTGSLAEKGAYVVIDSETKLYEEGTAIADRMIEAGDARIDDKWGPCGALPVVRDTYEVSVAGFDYLHPVAWRPRYGGPERERIEPNLLAAVQPLVKLTKGEEIVAVHVGGYSVPTNRRSSYHLRPVNEQRTGCSATVTIRRQPATRTVEVDVVVPGGLDYDQRSAAVDEYTRTMKLRAGEQVIATRIGSLVQGKPKVTALAPKAKTITKYVVRGSRTRETWETGFDTQAQARAWATKAIETLSWAADVTEWQIESVTRRETGEPLVSIRREVSTVTIKVQVTVLLANVKLPSTPDGWLFFGWASF